MSVLSFADDLANLDQPSLVALLDARPDVLVQPVPRGFVQLAQRLSGADSLVRALRTVNRDTITVGRGIVVLHESATVPALVRLLGAPERLVRTAVADLCGRGLAWHDSEVLRLPEPLEAHWSAEMGGRPVATIARSTLVEDLRRAVAAFGIATDGLRKPELITQLSELMADLPALVRVLTALPEPVRERLDDFRFGYDSYYSGYSYYSYPARGTRARGLADPTEALISAGLLLRVNNKAELPREVAVACWLAEHELVLTGRPAVPPAEVDQDTAGRTSRAAAQEALREVTSVLDEARSAPIAALKKGGIGTRERVRLAKRLSIAPDVLPLWIDLAYAAGLLALTDKGYAPTQLYPAWRAAEPSHRWATLAQAWYGLEHAPTSRAVDEDRDLPPPLPLGSAAGFLRRALLRAARSGASVRATGAEIDWFFPVHGYEPELRDDKVAAAVREAELLGVVATDVVSELGEHLLAGGEGMFEEAVAELAGRCARLLPEAPCSVILQSDLTVVVSGQPGAAVVRLLQDSAVAETHGAAGTWRFTPASVRGAFDAGWTADDLLTELKTISSHPVPQPLEYLVNDVARRHGQVRVRGMRSCVIADEALVTEILHTRALHRLHLSQLAPTVLASPKDLQEVLTRLRAAGLSPVPEDATGAVIVDARAEHQAPMPEHVATTAHRPRSQCTAAELAGQLLADPDGHTAQAAADSGTGQLLAQLNPRLCDAELDLLADAVDHQTDVLITYQDKNGTRTTRAIRPQQLYGRWLDSWCHLRGAQRDFTVAGIESVGPAS